MLKKAKIPPLFTISKDVAVLRNKLAAVQIHPLVKLCSMGTTIMCSTEEDFQAVGRFLATGKMEFFMHDALGSKPLKGVIRGLPDYDPEADQSVPFGRKGSENYRDKLYLVHLGKDSTRLDDLLKIKGIFNMIVDWEHYRPLKINVTQCGNCLFFGTVPGTVTWNRIVANVLECI